MDVLGGGPLHHVASTAVFERLQFEVRRGDYQVVWLAPPSSSFSVLHLRKTSQPLRTRAEPEGVGGLRAAHRAYVEEHNTLALRAARLAQVAYEAGDTHVIENPVDRGAVGSPYFSTRLRKHAPLWLCCLRCAVWRR